METLTSAVVEKEFEEINAILPTLWKEGLLTDFECRIIASCDKLENKKGAVYSVIMSKTKEEAANLTEMFRKMTLAIHGKENSISLYNASNNKENHYSVLPSKNPFLNNTIVKHLFGFLHLRDIKTSRLVCRQWNSTAEICLRKRSTIHFRHNVVIPHTFMEVSKYTHPDLPFPSFEFSDFKTSWLISVIEDFMKKWSKNIKEVTLDNITLASSKCNLSIRDVLVLNYDVTPLFINPSNITSLKINTYYDDTSKTTLDISLGNFVSIKTLTLSNCRIIVSVQNQSARIAPLNIHFQNVTFMKNGEIISHFVYNDLVDFSKAVNINLEQTPNDDDIVDTIFDMGRQVFNVDQFHLVNVSLKNWAQAKGDVQFLRLYGIPFTEKNHLKIKHIKFDDAKIDLTALPQTLEILDMRESRFGEIICSEPVQLLYLKCLLININYNNDSLDHFTNCPTLKQLEVYVDCPNTPCTFNLEYIPKSVIRMKMDFNPANIFGRPNFQLDNLILSGNYPTFTEQVKAKMVVVVFDAFFYVEGIDTSALLRSVLANKQSQKIVIGSRYRDLHKKIPFEGSELSKYVDHKSNCYQFENGVGKSITEAEFDRCSKFGDYVEEYIYISLF